MTREVGAGPHLPAQLTSFVGRDAELIKLRRLMADNRLVTLTGSGGVGKTRLALQLAGDLEDGFADGLWWVDLASTTDPELVAERVARAFGRLKQAADHSVDALIRCIGDRQILVVLDNCEHLLDACATLVPALLGACARLQILTTSREPLGVVGEATWLTPALSLTDEAIELFTQRARLVRADFAVAGDSKAAVAEICRRLDGVPLAIELAATRVRVLSLTEIVDGLQDRFGLLTRGARTAEPRQQTLRASVDWSHALLSEAEQVMFRQLAVFIGGFDLDAAHAVAGGAAVPYAQVVDELALLVDKSLVVADNSGPTTRYRMLETIRQYALEKLGESGEADAVHARHRDHYAAAFGNLASVGYRWRIEQAEIEIDNIRAALAWTRQHADIEIAAHLASSLLPLWIHSRTSEGLAWFHLILANSAVLTDRAHARALADAVIFEALIGDYYHIDQAEQAVAIARDLNDPALLAWALAACGFTCCYSPEIALPCFEEAIELSPALDDDWQLSQILGVQAFSAYVAGDLTTMRRAARKGRDLADRVGDWSVSLLCRLCKGLAHLHSGDLTKAVAQARQVATEAQAANDPLFSSQSLMLLAIALACQGDTGGARSAAEAAIEAATDLVAFQRGSCWGALVDALLAAGDVPAALAASDAACDSWALPQPQAINGSPVARAALASGDATGARRWADDALSVASGVHRITLFLVRVRVGIAEDAAEQAERDVHDALAIAGETAAYLIVPDLIECLATLATKSGRHREAARLFGSAAAIRDRTGIVRYKIYDADYVAAVDALRDALAQKDFDDQWAEGATLTTAEAIGYARRRRGARQRPSSGWDSLTPAERDIVRLVSQGLRNKDIAARLFISTRTVETHLTRIYTKLELSSRVQLAQEAGRRRGPQ
ncbi:MAG TPA: LuxR C-terminal-related transcriptional regulator [Mycobacterium sp.]